MARLAVWILGIAITPWVFAESHTDKTTQAEPNQVPSLIYLQYLNQQAPQLLCENNAVAQCLGLEAATCKSMVVTAAESCGPRLLEAWPSSFAETPENARHYSSQYRECIYRRWQRQGQVDALQLNLCQ